MESHESYNDKLSLAIMIVLCHRFAFTAVLDEIEIRFESRVWFQRKLSNDVLSLLSRHSLFLHSKAKQSIAACVFTVN